MGFVKAAVNKHKQLSACGLVNRERRCATDLETALSLFGTSTTMTVLCLRRDTQRVVGVWANRWVER